MTSNGSLGGLQVAASGSSDTDGGSSGHQDLELRRMAAFRVREAANRIAVLANGAQAAGLRQTLLGICQTLLHEERALLDDDRSAGDI
ncbi:MAG: hypothetical protein U0802_02705 [Candidatus Binatia bacterium]